MLLLGGDRDGDCGAVPEAPLGLVTARALVPVLGLVSPSPAAALSQPYPQTGYKPWGWLQPPGEGCQAGGPSLVPWAGS